MPLIKWEPFDEVERFFGGRPGVSAFAKIGWDLSVDVYEEGKNVVAKLSLPGVKPEEIDISVDRDTITVSGSRQEEQETDKKDYYSKEIRRGSFSRVVSLPKIVDADEAKAEYVDGVLMIKIPVVKGQEKKAVKVAVTKK
jgi:HSP20 family protein